MRSLIITVAAALIFAASSVLGPYQLSCSLLQARGGLPAGAMSTPRCSTVWTGLHRPRLTAVNLVWTAR